MADMDISIALAVGALLVGAALGALIAQSRFAAALATLRAAREAVSAQRDDLLAERDTARRERDGAVTERAALQATLARLEEQLSQEQARAAEQLRNLREARQEAQERLSDMFKALSTDALRDQSAAFLQLAEERLNSAQERAVGDLDLRRQAVEQLVAPLRETLGKVEHQLSDAERHRGDAQAALRREMELVRETSEQLRGQTAALVTALRKPQTRGRWGELQLRRVVEVAGMVDHCDFMEQQSDSREGEGLLRPDLVVRLAGGKSVVIDAKVPLAAFLEAAETTDEAFRDDRLKAHARHMRAHVEALAAKRYWERFTPCPEFVVLFVPGESFLSAALEHDPALQEDAARRKVVLATPMTLIALLRTVAYAWTQEAIADHAQQVLDLGRELYERLRTLGGHVDRLGRTLGTAVGAYNDAVGSLESRVLVTARRFHEARLVDAPIEGPRQVERTVRVISAEELRTDDRAESGGRVYPLPAQPVDQPTSLGGSQPEEATR